MADKKPANKPKKTPAVPDRGIEVTVIASYPRPRAWGAFGTSAGDAVEIRLAGAKTWHPTTDNFRIVAGTPNQFKKGLTEVFDISTVGEFIGAFTQKNGKDRPAKSVGRVNIVAHGNPGLIGLSGSLDDAGNVSLANSRRETASDPFAPSSGGGLDASVASWLNGSGKPFRTLARNVLRDDAELHLILCNGGLGRGLALMQDLALSLNLVVRGFSDAVFCHFTFAGQRILERNITSIGENGSQGKGYQCFVKVPQAFAGDHLKPDRSAAKPQTPAP
jgi:hypothetical protein